MLSSNKNIDQLQELAQDLFRRVQLQKRYVQLDIVKKLTILLSAFVIGAVVFLLVTISSFSFSVWQKNDYMRADGAVVMVPVTSVKSSPSEEVSKDLFILHEGTKVTILDAVGDWRNIELADGRQGWIHCDDIEVI